MYMWCIHTTKAFFSKNVFSKNALGNKQSQNKAMMIYVCAKRLMIWPIWLVRSVYSDPKYQKKLMPKFVQRSVWIAALWTGESENYFLSSQYSHKCYMCVVQRQKHWTLGDYSFTDSQEQFAKSTNHWIKVSSASNDLSCTCPEDLK